MPSATVHLHSATAAAVPIRLAATLFLPDTGTGPFPGLVVGHGAGSRRERHEAFCRLAASRGFVVLGLDFRGHGGSEGAADGPLEDDLYVAAGFLKKNCSVDAHRVCYRGSSMGGFYGLKAAALGTFAAAALLCPASPEVMLTGLDEYHTRDTEAGDSRVGRAQARDSKAGNSERAPAGTGTRWDVSRMKAYFEQQDSLAIAARVRCPVLLLHARDDDVVPLSHSLALAGHLAGDATLLALAGGTHTSAQHDPAMHALTIDWLLARPAADVADRRAG